MKVKVLRDTRKPIEKEGEVAKDAKRLAVGWSLARKR